MLQTYPEAVSMSNQTPVVSIVIPNYNHAQYLGDAIYSVLNQTYSHFEIIVVDDGSKDNSREVIDRFGDRVRAIYQQNRGLSAARNTGIQAAQGSLIGVLDADDIYEPMFLESLVGALQSNPEADGISCGYQFVDEKNQALPQVENRSIQSNEIYTALLDGNFLVPESILVRRHCYDASGPFDETLRACEDWDMWLRFTKKFRIIHSPQVLTRHRILRGSMSTDPLRMLTNRLAVLSKHVGSEPADSNDPDPIKGRAYGRAYLAGCVEYIQLGDENQAFKCFQKIANLCPELLTEIDTFYQLGCGDQPKGFMGDLASLNVKRSSLPLLNMMKGLFDGAGTSKKVKRLERTSYARAYYALGLLAYGTREFRESRRFFTQAVLASPQLSLNGKLIGLWLKSTINPGLLDRLRRIRNKQIALETKRNGRGA